ncbi:MULTISPECIES: MFS transporter [Pseudonocardia]|uniref:MFS transporter n=2 Tax=Pseudonocardia TaxID=1847 RepID=A0ABQ0S4C5_9PSEU|nr:MULTISPECIES: MFS transporter [Pseudonocardia]OSY38121.1 Proline/betaine transporter [Pseudonocardia autotrophica]TDN75562.1 MHS family proline/betaine transporter-like MFS transporter [Pseudonocardia autotrophica]BBF99532.1 MFS transporter [Pseudonocardia autotrophica]GEC27771.1 MFS transporter [Pseudonocardia saturnea]
MSSVPADPGQQGTHGEVEPSILRRAVAASAIGNATEWYDYGVYGYVAVIIGANFFPGDYERLFALLGLAVSFVLRPLGGIVWGPLGDRIGRQKVLAMTIILMGVATFLIGILPTFETIGVLAPILLILLRVVQGFSTGGEYGGAATFMAEYSPDRRRGFWGSFLEFGTMAGLTLAALVVFGLTAAVGSDAMNSWGWRIPFMLALPLALIGLYIRSKLEDTPVFRELEESGQAETAATGALKRLLVDYNKPIITLFGLVIALNVTNYVLLTYMPTYLQGTIGMNADDATLVGVLGGALMMVFIPMAGSLSDRIGRKPCWLISLTGVFVLAIPMYMLMGVSFGWAVVGFTVLGLVYALQLGTISATFPAMFPTHVRFAGMAISYNVATAIFGGWAPVASEALVESTGDLLVPAYFMMGASLVGLVALYFVIETKGSSLGGRELPGLAEHEARLAAKARA